MSNKLMDLNHETAMRLWVKSFGKQTKAIDFAGREIAKGAYNDRNSQYGWNVDHVLPQSKGGATADYNLVCCSIQTNDEKADKFPCFYANGCKFEIIKVQNHYEIKAVSDKKATPSVVEEDPNFYDSASGVRYFKTLKGIQNKKPFVGYVLIRLQNLQNTAVVDFIEKILEDYDVTFSSNNNNINFKRYYGNEIRILAANYNMPLREDAADLLDKCILLNTYLGGYFRQLKYLDSYEIRYAMVYFENKIDMYIDGEGVFDNLSSQPCNSILINELVAEKTEAKSKITVHRGFNDYNFIYTKLSENLKKEVEGK